jgi:hypothetical protein
MNTEEPAPELPFWVKALECLRPDQINVLTALAESGEIEIEDFIYRAMWEKFERYRKEHGLPEDWPFDKQNEDEHS